MPEKNKDTTKIYIKTDFPAAFLLNGTFSDRADGFKYPANEPLYITVLPLEAHLLPYTVKMLDGKSLYNNNLIASFCYEGEIFAKLLPRYNYLYENKKSENIRINATTPEKLFWAVKQNDFDLAKKFCTEGLLSTIDESGLESFFNDYTAIMPDEFTTKNSNLNNYTYQIGVNNYSTGEPFYLIDTNSNGVLFHFELVNGFVDNIVGKE